MLADLTADATSGDGARLDQVIPEQPHRLWLRSNDDRAWLADFSAAVHRGLGPPEPWLDWSRTTVAPGGRHIQWPDGTQWAFEGLLEDERVFARYAATRLFPLLSVQAIYRPFYGYLVARDVTPTIVDIRAIFDLDNGAWSELVGRYGAPSHLLAHRLLDLLRVVGLTYQLSATEIHRWLHWSWQSPRRQASRHWPTPGAAVMTGHLVQVEATLYPYLRHGHQP